MGHLLTRAEKGAPLTPTEADQNLDLLETRTGDGWFDNESKLYLRDGPNSADWQSFIGGITAMRFIPNEMREGFVDYHVKHEWKPGTMMYPHVHFTVLAQQTGVIRWVFEYTWANRKGSVKGNTKFQTPQTIVLEYSVQATDDLEHIVMEAPEGQGIVGTNMEVDAMIMCRLYRDGAHPNDTYAFDAYAMNVDLHTESDRHATPLRVTPFYAP